ncbi:MAG TPA: hypothetical protein VK694_05720 [Verrucomicrobiae bacterium]|nr:hypothetical protein [Verrucomicrobiae bacterium]
MELAQSNDTLANIDAWQTDDADQADRQTSTDVDAPISVEPPQTSADTESTGAIVDQAPDTLEAPSNQRKKGSVVVGAIMLAAGIFSTQSGGGPYDGR